MTRGIRDGDDDDRCVVSDEAVIVRETDKAVLVNIGRHQLDDDVDIADDVWIPKSVLHDDSSVYDPKERSRAQLIVKAWWARKQGWIE